MHWSRSYLLGKSLCEYPAQKIPKPIASFIFNAPRIQQTRAISEPSLIRVPDVSARSSSRRLPFPNLLKPFRSHEKAAHFSTESDDYTKEIDEINLKFAEAREEIEMALESKETVYFDEEAECARDAVKTVLDMFEGLLSKLPENEKAALQRSMGLKIEQLKAELQQLNE